jgi:hypothetical protein
MVPSPTVPFDRQATLDAAIFEPRRQDGSSVMKGATAAVVSFSKPDFIAGSPANGNKALSVHSGKTHDANRRSLDSNPAGGDRADDFFRLFGD